jgi:hypothetical protein
MTKYFWLLLPQFLALALMVGIAWFWKWSRARRQLRSPVKEKMLRPPGESLRRKLEELNESILDTLFIAVVGSMALGFMIQVQIMSAPTATIDKMAIGMVEAVGIIFLGVMGRRFWVLIKRRSDYDLGFKGERLVGEELNEVIRGGGYVFHDFPADPKWNIDHVVVTSAGVFSIETKTRRKRRAAPGKKDHEVVYDGQTLIFPNFSDSHGLQQAKDNARWLSQWLSKAVGDRVSVTPMLTLPGWWVVRKSNDGVRVLNPKEIRTAVKSNGSQALSDQMIQRIVHQLDQKCRDVEF